MRAGETFLVPPNVSHTFAVEADEPARCFITEFRPGLRAPLQQAIARPLAALVATPPTPPDSHALPLPAVPEQATP